MARLGYRVDQIVGVQHNYIVKHPGFDGVMQTS